MQINTIEGQNQNGIKTPKTENLSQASILTEENKGIQQQLDQRSGLNPEQLKERFSGVFPNTELGVSYGGGTPPEKKEEQKVSTSLLGPSYTFYSDTTEAEYQKAAGLAKVEAAKKQVLAKNEANGLEKEAEQIASSIQESPVPSDSPEGEAISTASAVFGTQEAEAQASLDQNSADTFNAIALGFPEMQEEQRQAA